MVDGALFSANRTMTARLDIRGELYGEGILYNIAQNLKERSRLSNEEKVSSHSVGSGISNCFDFQWL